MQEHHVGCRSANTDAPADPVPVRTALDHKRLQPRPVRLPKNQPGGLIFERLPRNLSRFEGRRLRSRSTATTPFSIEGPPGTVGLEIDDSRFLHRLGELVLHYRLHRMRKTARGELPATLTNDAASNRGHGRHGQWRQIVSIVQSGSRCTRRQPRSRRYVQPLRPDPPVEPNA